VDCSGAQEYISCRSRARPATKPKLPGRSAAGSGARIVFDGLILSISATGVADSGR
jgi:hypothetical protein